MVNDDIPQDGAGDEPDPTVPAAPARASGDVTLILSRIERGEPQAAEQLLPLVYEELRKLAAAKMAQEKPDQTLQATALVHEAYIRLVDTEQVQHWKSRGHFFATEQQRLAKQQAQLAQKQKRLAEDAAAREAKLRVDAEHATQQAEAARKQAETVTNYLVDIFRSPDPEKDGRTVTVVEVLDRAKEALKTKSSDDLTVKARLLAALGKTYRGLGLYEESLTQVEQCHEILRA